MKNKTLVLIFTFLLIVCLAVIIFVPKGNSGIVKVYVDGKEYKEIILSETEKSFTVDIGTGNVLLVEKDGVSMIHADCPDKLCIKRGKIKNSAYPIICLPNKVTVTMEGGEVDGVSS